MSMVEEVAVAQGPNYSFQASTWDRLVSSLKTLFFSGVLIWLALMVLALVAMPKRGPRAIGRASPIVAIVTSPFALFLAVRRFATQFHTLSYGNDVIELKSLWRSVKIDALQVDGLIGASGVKYSAGEMVIWRSLVLVVEGRAYTVSFDKDSNALCYEELREICVHAWGLPHGGSLAPPVAGPELSMDEYTLALAHLRKHFLRLTQKSLVTGLLMTGGSAAVIGVMLSNLNAGRLNMRIMFWIGVMGLVGLVLTIHALKQLLVAWKIREVQRRLVEAE